MPTPDQIWADADLPTRRLAGLALNPSVPENILLRLLSDAPLAVRMVLCRDRILPDAVVDAVIEHPDARTRGFFARKPHADPVQRVRLLDDPEWSVRGPLVWGGMAVIAGPLFGVAGVWGRHGQTALRRAARGASLAGVFGAEGWTTSSSCITSSRPRSVSRS